jgi:hypothetical protein
LQKRSTAPAGISAKGVEDERIRSTPTRPAAAWLRARDCNGDDACRAYEVVRIYVMPGLGRDPVCDSGSVVLS